MTMMSAAVLFTTFSIVWLSAPAASGVSTEYIKLMRMCWFLPIHMFSSIADYLAIVGSPTTASDAMRVSYDVTSAGGNTCEDHKLSSLYAATAGVWCAVILEFIYTFEHQDSDRMLMSVHHVATTLLLGLSWYTGHCLVGAHVLWWHDASDVLIMTLKIVAKIHLDRVVPIVYVACMAMWMYSRMYMFIWNILVVGLWSTRRELYSAPWTDLVLVALLGVLACAHLAWTHMLLKLPFKPRTKWAKEYEGTPRSVVGVHIPASLERVIAAVLHKLA